MNRRFLSCALLAAAASSALPALAAPPLPPPDPNPRIEFTAFLFLFPWVVGPAADMLDPIDINAIDILFDTIEDPDAFDNPPHG